MQQLHGRRRSGRRLATILKDSRMTTNSFLARVSIALAIAFGGAALAATDAAPAAASAAAGLTAGEIRKIDAAQGKVTIKHEAIQNLDMPAMTMVFRLASADLLAQAQVGDKVRFRAENKAGAMVVTEIRRGD